MKSKRLTFSSIGGRLLLLAALLCSSVLAANAHTFHTSLARMDYNAEKKLFEVSIQLFSHDLQPLLEKRLKKRVDLEKTPEVETELRKYLGEHFVLRNGAGETQKLVWVGREFEHDSVYLYLEIPFEGDSAAAKLQNTIFFESFKRQTNHVVVRRDGKKSGLLFKAGDREKELTV